MYSKVTTEIFAKLSEIVGIDNIFNDYETIEKYSKDETEDLAFPPEIVIKPETTKQVAEILRVANDYKVPVYTRGGGTGLSGGALPVYGGIVLSTERFNKIIDIDKNNFQVTVESGVITQVLQEELEKQGLFYPVDPASRGSCYIGGNVAECSGGPRAAKYGVTRNYILSIEFVTPEGKIITTGSNTIKNVTGYSLTQLLCGSEGTLGVITKITFRIIALPKFRKMMLLAFPDVMSCISSVSEFYLYGINPSVLEFIEKEAALAAEYQLNKHFPNNMAEAHLMIELDGDYIDVIDSDMQKIAEIAENFSVFDIKVAEDSSKMEELWQLRRSIGEAVKSISVYKELDTVVPRAQLPFLLSGVKEICSNFGIKSICYGHAGDGNLHVNILKENLSDEYWNGNINNAVERIFKLTVSLGGTISGEHGIGYSQKEFLPIALSDEEIILLNKIKKTFDPNNILNPGKIIPEKYDK